MEDTGEGSVGEVVGVKDAALSLSLTGALVAVSLGLGLGVTKPVPVGPTVGSADSDSLLHSSV